MSRTAAVLVMTGLVIALALGAVAVYASGNAPTESCARSLTRYESRDFSGSGQRRGDGPFVERICLEPLTDDHSPFGEDDALLWGYAAGAVLLLTGAGAVLARLQRAD